MSFALLLLVALLSYHPLDVSANGLPTNPSVRNWIGPFGAWMAYYWLLWIGAAAYELPALACALAAIFSFTFLGLPVGLGATLIVAILILRRAGPRWRRAQAPSLVSAAHA